MKPTAQDHKDAQAMIAKLEAEVAALKAAKRREVEFRVSPKGGVSVYGLGRFPVTLYKEQWRKLFQHFDALGDFIDEHEEELSEK